MRYNPRGRLARTDMANEISKTQIDRLGERLKRGNITEADLRMLDQYRRSFTEAYDVVVRAVREKLSLEPTGRPAKSTTSISDKLRRESIRLTQIQDIAGCRLIATDIANQNAVVQSLTNLFEHTIIVDRRQKPSHGYRAVHVIVNHGGKMIEIQVRTSLQHLWAELSEKISDKLEPSIKYGGGNKYIQEALKDSSSMIAEEELLEIDLVDRRARLSSQGNFTGDKKKEIDKTQNEISSRRQELFKFFSVSLKRIEEIEGDKNDISD